MTSSTAGNEQQLRSFLRRAGERLTSPRLAIFRLITIHSPLAMSRLIELAKADGVDPVTTYRTMALFGRLGLVQEFGLGRNRLFELGHDFHAHHHHLTCTGCGQVTPFDDSVIEAALQQAASGHNFTIRSHQLEAVGLCRQCAAKRL